jgi:hypothetical protein
LLNFKHACYGFHLSFCANEQVFAIIFWISVASTHHRCTVPSKSPIDGGLPSSNRYTDALSSSSLADDDDEDGASVQQSAAGAVDEAEGSAADDEGVLSLSPSRLAIKRDTAALWSENTAEEYDGVIIARLQAAPTTRRRDEMTDRGARVTRSVRARCSIAGHPGL